LVLEYLLGNHASVSSIDSKNVEDYRDYIWNSKIESIKRPVKSVSLNGIITTVHSNSGLVKRCNKCKSIMYDTCPKKCTEGWGWDLVIQLGNAIEKVVSNPESICEEIKTILHDEIREKLISSRDIERYCLDKWKKKTKPKNDNLSFSSKDTIVMNRHGNGSSSEADSPNNSRELQEHYDNIESWNTRLESTSRTIDIEFSLTFEDVRRYMLTLSNPYLPSRPIWFNAKVDIITGKAITAHTGRIPVTNDSIPTQFGN